MPCLLIISSFAFLQRPHLVATSCDKSRSGLGKLREAVKRHTWCSSTGQTSTNEMELVELARVQIWKHTESLRNTQSQKLIILKSPVTQAVRFRKHSFTFSANNWQSLNSCFLGVWIRGKMATCGIPKKKTHALRIVEMWW